MKLAAAVFCVLVASGLFGAATGNAQRTSEEGPVPIVEVVGCLTSDAGDTWALTNASDPVVSGRPTQSAEGVRAAAARPLGKQRYRLLGVAVFHPADHSGHKVVVKGLFIRDQKEPRINVTSLQMAAAGCAESAGKS